jgi:hypothetical protein
MIVVAIILINVVVGCGLHAGCMGGYSNRLYLGERSTLRSYSIEGGVMIEEGTKEGKGEILEIKAYEEGVWVLRKHR